MTALACFAGQTGRICPVIGFGCLVQGCLALPPEGPFLVSVRHGSGQNGQKVRVTGLAMLVAYLTVLA